MTSYEILKNKWTTKFGKNRYSFEILKKNHKIWKSCFLIDQGYILQVLEK